MAELTHRATQQKKDIVKRIAELLIEYPIIGAVNMENLPAAQLQRMTSQLRNKIILLMTKKRLIFRAIEEMKKEKKDIEKLKDYLNRMPALLFTKENPFSLFKTLKKSKSQAPAKSGQIAPKDLVIPSGPTPFAPGPIIGELGALGIKAGVEGGKVAVKQDAVVCKEGEVINDKVASLITRLGIEPMEVGLNLTAVYEDGIIYPSKILDIDESAFMQDLMNAASYANALAMEIAYVTKGNAEELLQKAFREAKALALEANILSDAVVEELVAKAEREMIALKEVVGELPEKAEEKKETIERERKAEIEKTEPEKAEVGIPTEQAKIEEKITRIEKVEKFEEQKSESAEKLMPEEKSKAEVEPAIKPEVIEKFEQKAEIKEPKKTGDEIKKAEEIFEQLKKKAAETGKPVSERIIKDVKVEESESLAKAEPLKAAEEAKKEKSAGEFLIKPVDELIRKEEQKLERVQKEIAEEKDEHKKAEKIFEQLQKKAAATGRPVSERIIPSAKEPIDAEKANEIKQQKERKEQEAVEELTKELVKKGTLRKEKGRGL